MKISARKLRMLVESVLREYVSMGPEIRIAQESFFNAIGGEDSLHNEVINLLRLQSIYKYSSEQIEFLRNNIYGLGYYAKMYGKATDFGSSYYMVIDGQHESTAIDLDLQRKVTQYVVDGLNELYRDILIQSFKPVIPQSDPCFVVSEPVSALPGKTLDDVPRNHIHIAVDCNLKKLG